MAIAQRRLTLEEFLALPEEEPALEYYDGVVVQKVSPQGQHSALQPVIAELFNRFGRPKKLAFAFTELRATYGRYSLVPDVAVYRWHRIPRTADGKIANRFSTPPDIAVEIVSPDQSVTVLAQKCLVFLERGTGIALLVNPADESVVDFRAGAEPRMLRGDDQIDLNPVVPAFQLTVRELFDALRLD